MYISEMFRLKCTLFIQVNNVFSRSSCWDFQGKTDSRGYSYGMYHSWSNEKINRKIPFMKFQLLILKKSSNDDRINIGGSNANHCK